MVIAAIKESEMPNRDSHDKSSRSFEPHGHASMYIVEKNIVVYKSTGPFNEEFLKSVEALETKALRALTESGKYRGEIIIFEKSCMATNGMFEYFPKYLQNMKQEGLGNVISSFVFPEDVEGSSMMAPHYEKCYASAGIKFGAFKQYDAALSWVKAELESIDAR